MKEMNERKQQICRKYNEGASIRSLSSEYGISERTIEDIINRTRRKQQDSVKDRLMQDAEGKKKELDQIRKIQVGDVVKVWHDTVDAMGNKCTDVLTGEVICKNKTLIAVQGEHYTESFSVFDLASNLVEHIPS